jgi:hypothetical protein
MIVPHFRAAPLRRLTATLPTPSLSHITLFLSYDTTLQCTKPPVTLILYALQLKIDWIEAGPFVVTVRGTGSSTDSYERLGAKI